MDKLTKDFLKFIANNIGLLDEETIRIINNNNIKLYLTDSNNFELELLGCNDFIESNEIIALNYDDCRYELSKNFSKLFMNSFLSPTTKISYKDQLNHEFWKDKRNHIISIRGSKCERCGSKDFLQVHHKRYIKGRLAWEYEDNLLECLCGNCHKKHHEQELNGNKEEELKRWLLCNSVSKDESKMITENKIFILNYFQNEVVNKIVNCFELHSSSKNAIRFKVNSKMYYKYLHSLFGEDILDGSSNIGFHLNDMRKKRRKRDNLT